MRRRGVWAAAVAFVAAAVLLPTAAQADPSFYASPMFGIDTAPGGQLLVADAGRGVVDADTGALVAAFGVVAGSRPCGRSEQRDSNGEHDGRRKDAEIFPHGDPLWLTTPQSLSANEVLETPAPDAARVQLKRCR